MDLGIYDSVTMLEAVEQMPPAKSFLWDTFVDPQVEYEPNEIAQFDYTKGSERMAPFVDANVGGVVMDRDGYDSVFLKFPTIAPERMVTKKDALRRQAGETAYNRISPAERAMALLNKDLSDLRRAVKLRQNWMVAQLLFNTPGQMVLDVMTDKGLKYGAMRVRYDFTNTVTIDTPWNQTGADPMGDIELITDTARDTGGANPDIIIMGVGAAQAYRKNENVMQIMDIRNASFGTLEAGYAGDYLKFLGYSPNGLEMYSYSATYLADNGTVQSFVPSGCVAALSRNLLRAVFGPVVQLEPFEIYPSYYDGYQEVPMFLPDYRKNTTGLRLTSSPMLVPQNADGWGVADVLS